MANAVTELQKVAGSLPEGDPAWERILADKQLRPKLEARLRQVKKKVAAGKSEPFDFSRL